MTTITLENIDNIISYLKPKEKMLINSQYRNEAINESKNIIRKNTNKWMLAYSEEMDNNHYYVPIMVYKKYYPLKYRRAFIEKVLDITADTIKYNIVCEIVSEYSSLVDQFNHVVEILSDDELFRVGW
jgi:hypothetical protein